MHKGITFCPVGFHQLHTASKGRRRALIGVWKGLVWPQKVKELPVEIPVTFCFNNSPNIKIITGEISFQSWDPSRGLVENYFAGGFKSEDHLVFGYTKKEDRIIGWGNLFFHLSPDSQKMEGSVVGLSSHTGSNFYSEMVLLKGKNPDLREYSKKRPTVFIGHGRSMVWKQLKKYLLKTGYQVETYESGVRAGKTINDVLTGMMTDSSFALLIMTGEDKTDDGKLRARQNVVHEVGLFQGRLGINRAIILLEKGVEEFSNVKGITYIPFRKNKITDAFKEIVATIKREFPH
jgi:hypothetical protein